MPYKDLEIKKQKAKEKYEKNKLDPIWKAKEILRFKKYRDTHKEKEAIRHHEYNQKHRKQESTRQKKYRNQYKSHYLQLNKKWFKEHPEELKNYLIKSHSKYFDELKSQNKFHWNKFNKTQKLKYRILTNLLFNNLLPKKCEWCSSTKQLHTHHLKYTYPILQRNLSKLCIPCHNKAHNKTTYKNEKERKAKEKLNRETRKLHPQIQPCSKCGSLNKINRNHLKPTTTNINFLCSYCHQNKYHNPYAEKI